MAIGPQTVARWPADLPERSPVGRGCVATGPGDGARARVDAVKKTDREQLLEIALRNNAGDEAQAGKMAKRLWRVRRWAAEQIWRASQEEGRRAVLERFCASLDGALQELEHLKGRRDAPATASETSPAAEFASAAPEICQGRPAESGHHGPQPGHQRGAVPRR